MKALIIGARGSLGSQLCKSLSHQGMEIYGTSRNAEDLGDYLAKMDVPLKQAYSVDFTCLRSIQKFMVGIKAVNFDLIVFVSSPFLGAYAEMTEEELLGWNNFTTGATLIGKFSITNLSDSGKLIYIGSVAGMLNKLPKAIAPYGVYKGTLRLLAEAMQNEGVNAHYINLGSFRDEKSKEGYLFSSEVVSSLIALVDDANAPLQLDLMSETERLHYYGKAKADISSSTEHS